jgi:hypothetical protein
MEVLRGFLNALCKAFRIMIDRQQCSVFDAKKGAGWALSEMILN